MDNTDRFDRAIALIRNDAVRPGWSADIFIVESQSSSREYTVQGLSCSCPDMAQHGNMCKHILASYGRQATLAVAAFRGAASENDLAHAGSLFARVAPEMPYVFVSMARSEYKRALLVFRAAQKSEVA